MPKLTITHSADIYEVTFSSTHITHIDKLIGESEVRREIVFEKVPKQVQDEILILINLDED